MRITTGPRQAVTTLVVVGIALSALLLAVTLVWSSPSGTSGHTTVDAGEAPELTPNHDAQVNVWAAGNAAARQALAEQALRQAFAEQDDTCG